MHADAIVLLSLSLILFARGCAAFNLRKNHSVDSPENETQKRVNEKILNLESEIHILKSNQHILIDAWKRLKHAVNNAGINRIRPRTFSHTKYDGYGSKEHHKIDGEPTLHGNIGDDSFQIDRSGEHSTHMPHKLHRAYNPHMPVGHVPKKSMQSSEEKGEAVPQVKYKGVSCKKKIFYEEMNSREAALHN